MIGLQIVVFLLGAILVASTVGSAITAVVVPRGTRSWTNALVARSVGAVLGLIAARRKRYEDADRLLALEAPLSLILLVATWLVLVLAGFSLMLWALDPSEGFGEAFHLAGSSLTTLGFAPADGLAERALAFIAAGIGLLLLTLMITYLPTMYGQFSQREARVTMLETRAGSPPTAVEFLIRYHSIGRIHLLDEEWLDWEAWFASLEESHTSYPSLVFFRSPAPDRSWVTAAGAVLDAASLWLSTFRGAPEASAAMTIRAGYIALRRISDYFGIGYDPDPTPGDPISITRYEFDQAWDQMAKAGMPLVDDRDEAWRAFAGWRVNYDTVLLTLAEFVHAPYAPWTSDRSTPDHIQSHPAAIWPGLRRRPTR